ncbi:MAG: hypothetical protein JXC35_01390 [Acholeplasmataceae bacterium]|nr:hypothetical protein [Acholeplasmataceae bacterium]
MYSNLVRNIVQLDKKARESVDEYKIKKENINHLVNEEEIRLKKEMLTEIKTAVKNLENKYKNEIKIKLEQEKIKFDAALNEIITIFEREKDVWVETIFQSCIK